MDRAIAVHIKTGQSFPISAKELAPVVEGNSSFLEEHELISPVSATPLHFVRPYSRNGNEVLVRAHFSRAAGHGNQDHVFDFHKNTAITLKDALDKNMKILLSLNLNLSFRRMNFRLAQSPPQYKLEHWIQQNHRNYISVPVHSAEEAVKTILKIHEYAPEKSLKQNVYALYMGGVLPYQEFYLGHRKQDLTEMFNSLVSLRKGLKHGTERIIGLPRLVQFVPTQTTMNKEGAKDIRGNAFYIDEEKKMRCGQLIFSEHDIEKKPEFKKLWNDLVQSMKPAQPEKRGVFVLASPTISIEGETGNTHDKWQYVRWVINDIASQVVLPLSSQPSKQSRRYSGPADMDVSGAAPSPI